MGTIKHILFWVNSDTQVKNIAPVYEILKNYDDFAISAVSTDSIEPMHSAEYLKTLGIPFELVAERQSNSLLPKRLRSLFYLRAFQTWTEQYLRVRKSDLVIFGNDYLKFNKIAIHVAHKLGVRTMLIQDGVIMEPCMDACLELGIVKNSLSGTFRSIRFRKIRISTFLQVLCEYAKETFANLIRFVLGLGYLNNTCTLINYGRGGCSIYAVSGEVTKELLIRRGTASGSIYVTGMPRYDSRSNNSLPLPDDLCKLFSPNQRNVVWANDILEFEPMLKITYFAELQEYVTSLFSAMKGLPEYNFIVKPHPRNKLATFTKALEIANATNVHIVQDCEMLDLLRNADALICYLSTSIMEALMSDKPVVVINFNKYPSPYILGEDSNGIFQLLSRIEDLGEVLKATFSKNVDADVTIKRKKYVCRNLFLLDGKASRRVAEIILGL